MSGTPPRRNPHGLTRQQKGALALLEHYGAGKLHMGCTQTDAHELWVNWNTAVSLENRLLAKVDTIMGEVRLG